MKVVENLHSPLVRSARDVPSLPFPNRPESSSRWVRCYRVRLCAPLVAVHYCHSNYGCNQYQYGCCRPDDSPVRRGNTSEFHNPSELLAQRCTREEMAKTFAPRGRRFESYRWGDVRKRRVVCNGKSVWLPPPLIRCWPLLILLVGCERWGSFGRSERV